MVTLARWRRCRACAFCWIALCIQWPQLRAEMRIAQGEALKAAVRKPAPRYNPVARDLRVEGEVEVEVAVSETGDVERVKILSGNALLTGEVVRTVKEWRFTPFLSGGKPAVAVTQLKFTFKL